VRVVNIAMGGADSSISAMILKYGLLPPEIANPHIVILAHAANDARGRNRTVAFDNLQDSIRSASRLNACDENDLPLVILLDDLYEGNLKSAMGHSGTMFELASWYQTMMIGYGNIVRNDILWEAVGEMKDEKREWKNNTHVDVLMGSNWHLHMGEGLHIGIAWAVLYNILVSIVRACRDDGSRGGGGGLVPSYTKLPRVEDSVRVTRYASYGNVAFDATTNLPALKEYIRGKTSPVKFMSGLEHTTNIPKQVHDDWLLQVQSRNEACNNGDGDDDESRMCTYAWMVNRGTGIKTKEDLERALSDVRASQTGWEVSEKPQTGWFARKEKASFSLEIPVTAKTNYLTVLSMVSYGPKFVGANLLLSLNVQKNGKNVAGRSTIEYNVTGYHRTKTSIHVPHKFKLPDGGANSGEIIFINGTLSSGSHFKIAGLALCRV